MPSILRVLPGMTEVATSMMKRRIREVKMPGIEAAEFFNLDYVDPKGRQLSSMEGEKVGYDMLILASTQASIAVNPDVRSHDSWIPVDKYRLNIAGYDDAYAIGDVAALPTAKTGVTAHLEA